MKKFLTIFLFSVFIFSANAQTNQKFDAWNYLLDDVKVKYVFSPKYNAMISRPKFGDKLLALNGKIINVRGFFLPVDVTGSVFVLSYNPSNMCFFCSGAGIESIVELKPTPREQIFFENLKTDNYFEARGKLILNADDYDHLIYILEDAELVKKIKQ